VVAPLPRMPRAVRRLQMPLINREETMPRQAITTDNAPKPGGHFAQAIAVEATGRLVFISGMVAQRPDGTIAGIGDVEAQTRQGCENVKALVEAAGGTLANVCRVDVYVRNMENLAPIHKVRREFFPSPPPASTLVEVSKFTHPAYLSEMSAIAGGWTIRPRPWNRRWWQGFGRTYRPRHRMEPGNANIARSPRGALPHP